MPNQPDPNSNQPASQTSVPVASFSQTDLPPLPPDFQAMAEPQNTSPAPQSSQPGPATPPSTPPIITSSPKKKFGGGRIIATILGILLLVGGVGAGIILTQQRQLFQQKAQVNPPYVGPVPDVTVPNVGAGQVAEGCVVENLPGQNGNTSDSNQAVGRLEGCGSTSGGVVGGGAACGGCYPAVEHGVKSIARAWVSNDYQTPTHINIKWNYTGGDACEFVDATWVEWSKNSNMSGISGTCNSTGCIKTFGDTGAGNIHEGCTLYDSDGCYRIPVEPNTRYYFRVLTIYSPRNSDAPDQICPTDGTHILFEGPAPTPTATPAPTAQCSGVKTYSSNNTLLTATDLSKLKAGDTVKFCATGTGTVDKYKFTINGVDTQEITTPAEALGYCYTYTIPPAKTSFSVSAQLHNASGWVGP